MLWRRPTLGGRIRDHEDRIIDLEGLQLKVTWFEQLDTDSGADGTSGQFSPPTGGTILLDQFDAGVDVLVSGIDQAAPTTSMPDFTEVLESDGTPVTGTLDASGNWTLSGTPDAGTDRYVALVYVYRVALNAYDRTKQLEDPDIEDYNPANVAISGGTINGAVIGGSTPAAGTFTRLNLDDGNTYLDVDGSNNMIFVDAVTGTLTLAEASCPPLIDVTDSSVAEGNNSVTGLNAKYLIKWIEVTTTSTDWTIISYSKDDYSTDARTLTSNRSGDLKLYLDKSYEDADASSEFHYNFSSASGSETHDIRIIGFKLR